MGGKHTTTEIQVALGLDLVRFLLLITQRAIDFLTLLTAGVINFSLGDTRV